MLWFLFSVFSGLILCALIVYTVLWCNHWNESKSERYQYGYVSFKRFLDEFEKYSNKVQHVKSVWNEIYLREYSSRSSYTYKEIVMIRYYKIEFNNKRMIINYCDYWKFLIWFNMYFYEQKPKMKITW
jgi:hypothetical protein